LLPEAYALRGETTVPDTQNQQAINVDCIIDGVIVGTHIICKAGDSDCTPDTCGHTAPPTTN
jgi:hypothetical protein